MAGYGILVITKNSMAITNICPGLYTGWAVRRLQDRRFKLHLPALWPSWPWFVKVYLRYAQHDMQRFARQKLS